MPLSAIYFDLDGTLVDSEHLHAVSWNKVLAMFDLHFSEAEFCQQFAGKPTLEAAKVLVEEHQLGLSASALAKKKHIVFAEISKLQLPALLPGAKALLAWCREQGLKVALVTGSAKEEAHSILTGHDLAKYFDVIFTRDDVEQPKPHPEPYLRAIAHFSLTASSGLAVEDTVTGSSSAKSAELYTVVVPNKYSLTADFSHADSRCSSLLDVQALIASKL